MINPILVTFKDIELLDPRITLCHKCEELVKELRHYNYIMSMNRTSLDIVFSRHKVPLGVTWRIGPRKAPYKSFNIHNIRYRMKRGKEQPFHPLASFQI